MVSNKAVKDFVAKWRAIEAASNATDYMRGQFMHKARHAFGGDFGTFITNHLGYTGGHIAKFRHMADAFEAIKDKNVWQAVGWDGIKFLYCVKPARKRAQLIRIVMSNLVNGVVKSRNFILRLVTSEAPESLRHYTRTVDTKAVSQQEDKRVVMLATEIMRLVDDGYGFLLNAMSVEARKIVTEVIGEASQSKTHKKTMSATG